MTNHLTQPPHLRLNLNLCEKLYDLYLNKTSDLFVLPTFEERYKGKFEGILGSVSQSYGGKYLFQQ